MYKGLAAAPEEKCCVHITTAKYLDGGVARDERISFCLAYRTALTLRAWS
jgi:hypothetical protein